MSGIYGICRVSQETKSEFLEILSTVKVGQSAIARNNLEACWVRALVREVLLPRLVKNRKDWLRGLLARDNTNRSFNSGIPVWFRCLDIIWSRVATIPPFGGVGMQMCQVSCTQITTGIHVYIQ